MEWTQINKFNYLVNEWNLGQGGYHSEIETLCSEYGTVHFADAPPNFKPWQNAMFVVEIDPTEIKKFKEDLIEVRKQYAQDSIEVIEGKVKFI